MFQNNIIGYLLSNSKFSYKIIKRRKSKEISIGNVKVGNNAPISVQSMCNTDTRDVKTTLEQINSLARAGCEIVRLAVLNKEAGEATVSVRKRGFGDQGSMAAADFIELIKEEIATRVIW